MKDITNILRRSKITPYERVKVLIENTIHYEETGKNLLPDADLIAITENWIPKHSAEINQYNKYIRIAKLRTTMNLDAKMFYLQSENRLLRIHGLIDYVKENKLASKDLIRLGLDSTEENRTENLNYLLDNTYLSYSKILQQKTFLSLPKEVQDDLLLLDEYIKHDSQYLDDHILLYELYKDSDVLSEKQKDILFEKIYQRIKTVGTNGELTFVRYGFFSEFTTEAVVCHCADYLDIKYNKEDEGYWNNIVRDIKKCAKDKKVSVKSLVREIIFDWLDKGLFKEEYTLLFKSESYETWSKSTKRKHKELFFIWLEHLEKTRKQLNELFDSGDLIKNGNNITGSSLYYSKLDEDFVSDYKEQINYILPITGIFRFIQNDIMPIKCYKTLQGFRELSKKISDIFDINVNKKFEEYENDYYNQVISINMKFARFIDGLYNKIYINKKLQYEIEMNPDAFYFDVHQKSSPFSIINDYNKLIKDDC
ncbi:hypothetical protein GW764_01635 [Candidatus Parcubacteria bacterium]|nr:hypothetical protein [Candidatus Parcubacteria bacterium]